MINYDHLNDKFIIYYITVRVYDYFIINIGNIRYFKDI